MNFEHLQKAWQSQDASAKVTINADALLKEVRRNQQQFRATIFWRDVREVGVAFLLAAFFSYRGLRSGDWTHVLVGLACVGVGTFMLVDRLLQQRKQTTAKDPLKFCVEVSLNQVNHQIWLLKNVFWWYLLPIAAAVAISFGHSAWRTRNPGSSAIVSALVCALVVALVYWGIYWVNQFAVRTSLQPRRQELETLLASLNENPR
jgi:lipopolysaccharide export LptBFGC system permease protein LptF